jgi:hypothetical protein
MDPNIQYSKNQSPQALDQAAEMRHIPYREAVGSPLHLAVVTRPDVAFPIGILLQFTNNPGRTRWLQFPSVSLSSLMPLAIATGVATHRNYLTERSSIPTNAAPFASVKEIESESKETSKYSSQSSVMSNTLCSLMEDLFNWYLSHNILRGLEHFPMTRP